MIVPFLTRDLGITQLLSLQLRRISNACMGNRWGKNKYCCLMYVTNHFSSSLQPNKSLSSKLIRIVVLLYFLP